MTTTALLCVARNELPYTEEWLEHHLSLGVDHIYYVSTDTDFGAENVRSKPGTRPLNGLIWFPFGESPVPGASPARIARRSSPVTASARFRIAEPVPSQRPSDSPLPL